MNLLKKLLHSDKDLDQVKLSVAPSNRNRLILTYSSLAICQKPCIDYTATPKPAPGKFIPWFNNSSLLLISSFA